MYPISHQIASGLQIYYWSPCLNETVRQQKSNLKTVKRESKINRVRVQS